MTIKPGTIIGFRKDGRPIHLIAGGSEGVPEPTPAPAAPAAATYTHDQFQAAIVQARQETENQFASRIEGLTSQFATAQQQLAALQQERDERQAAARAEAERLTEEQRAAERENMTLKERIEADARDNAARFEQLNAELSRRDALLAKEREMTELNTYRMARLSEVQDPDPVNGHPGIVPQLRDLVRGTTREEIDQSISTMVAKTGAILKEMQEAQEAARVQMPGVAPTAGNIGVMDQMASARNYSAEDISALPPGSEEHMRLRAAYGIGGARSGQGMFG